MAVSVRGLRLTFLYLLSAVAAASILSWALHDVLPFSYEKILSRSVLLFCALGLVPLWRWAGLSSSGVGLSPPRYRDLPVSFVTGVALVLPLMLFFFVVGYRVGDDRVTFGSAEFALRALGIFLSAALVGLFEEVLFRGVLFSAMCRTASTLGAGIAVGLVYAAVHFLGAGSSMPNVDSVHWYSGFMAVGAALTGLSDPLAYWDSFLALALLGAGLCWVRVGLGLWWCIGLHWAFVFAIRMYKELTVRDVLSPYAATVGSYDNFVGHAVSLWLVFLVVCALLVRTHRLGADH